MADQARTMMERQLGQMVHLIDDLLDLSRISRGKIELRKERIEVAKAIQQAVETSRPTIKQAGHNLRIEVPPGPIYVDADITRLAQVFSNLLNNAAKYTEGGGQIRLSVRRDGTEVVVSVRDTGVGIPPYMLPKVFDIFTQVDRNLERSQGGLGIGLSIVKRLVEMHGGSVEARSDGHGMGSEFVVRLPVVLSVVQPLSDEAEPLPPSSRRRVLVVDDNRDAAVSLAMMLKLMGNETKTAHDGLEALDVAAAYQPDLILLDIGMPKMNGYDTARHIRQQACINIREQPTRHSTPTVTIGLYAHVRREELRATLEAIPSVTDKELRLKSAQRHAQHLGREIVPDAAIRCEQEEIGDLAETRRNSLPDKRKREALQLSATPRALGRNKYPPTGVGTTRQNADKSNDSLQGGPKGGPSSVFGDCPLLNEVVAQGSHLSSDAKQAIVAFMQSVQHSESCHEQAPDGLTLPSM